MKQKRQKSRGLLREPGEVEVKMQRGKFLETNNAKQCVKRQTFRSID